MIKIENLHKQFGDRIIYKGLDLNVRKGETLTVIGQSGEGKSVLLKHITGLLEPDEGRVLVDNEDMTNANYNDKMQIRKKIGMLFQMAALFDSMTVGENVAFGLREHHELPEDEIAKIVANKLELVNLKGFEKPHALRNQRRYEKKSLSCQSTFNGAQNNSLR